MKKLKLVMLLALSVSTVAFAKETVSLETGKVIIDGSNVTYNNLKGVSSNIMTDKNVVSVKVKDQYLNKSKNKSLVLFEQTSEDKDCKVSYFIASLNDKEATRTPSFGPCSDLPKEWGDFYLSLLMKIE